MQAEKRIRKFNRFFPVLLPILSLIIVVAGLSVFYFQEKEINREVVALNNSAEKVALKEDYYKAKKLLEKAIEKRPNYMALKDNLTEVDKAITYEKSLGKVSECLKKTEFDAASKELASLKEKLSGEIGPLFEPFHKQIKDKEVKITVGTIKKELNGLTTIDQLAGKLSILVSLPDSEASAVKQEILNKIVQISNDEVESELTNKQFTEAFVTIDKGLQYAVNNEKLLSLKTRVEQDKNAFEKAEQGRIEQAMEAAAKEDLKNRTAAVEVSNLSIDIDEYGDLYIAGDVENIATTSISSITIYYTINDINGSYIDDGNASVYPYSLEPGETGDFEDTYYGVYEKVNVEIDNITWYLN